MNHCSQSHEQPQPASLPGLWRKEADNARAWGADGTATAIERCAEELEAALAHGDDELLTLTQAAELTGYTADHLGRQIRAGKLTNRGRKNTPRVRRGDLTPKPGALPAAAGREQIDRDEIARAVINLHVGGKR